MGIAASIITVIHLATGATGTLTTVVSEYPAGLTLIFRLPDGVVADAVTVDGVEAPWETHHRGGIEFVRVVLSAAGEGTEVQVTGAAQI